MQLKPTSYREVKTGEKGRIKTLLNVRPVALVVTVDAWVRETHHMFPIVPEELSHTFRFC